MFIKAFFKSKENVNNMKKIFGKHINLNLIIKDFTKGIEKLELNIDNVDPYISCVYTEDDLGRLLSEEGY